MNEKPVKDKISFGVREFFSLFFRILLGLIFIYASYSKILNPYSFYRATLEYELLPLFAVPVFSIILPWIEMFTGLCLIFGALYRSSNLIFFVMLVVFEMGIIINLLRGRNMDCGCGLPLDLIGISEKLTWMTVLRDSVFIFMSAYLVFLSKPRFTLDRLLLRRKSAKKLAQSTDKPETS
ncbi:DoxX family membrane protein [bacterium]|nr:DoxX family membrane protein [bacterium]